MHHEYQVIKKDFCIDDILQHWKSNESELHEREE